MRNLSICFLLTVVLAFSGLLYAQEEEPHVFTVVTFELLIPEDGSRVDFDSLSGLWTDNISKKNEFIVSEITMSHLWGNNSNDYFVITEFRSFADIEKAQNRDFELLKEGWPDKEERQQYFNTLTKYFRSHSDEIYQEETSIRN